MPKSNPPTPDGRPIQTVFHIKERLALYALIITVLGGGVALYERFAVSPQEMRIHKLEEQLQAQSEHRSIRGELSAHVERSNELFAEQKQQSALTLQLVESIRQAVDGMATEWGSARARIPARARARVREILSNDQE